MQIRRAVTQRRGGALGVTVGYLAVAASSAVLLACGARVLGQSAFSGLGLVWTFGTVFGLGLANPTEQVIIRRLNVGASDGVRRPFLFLCGAALVVLAVVLVWGSSTPAADSFPPLAWGSALAVIGWTVACLARGSLAGRGDLRSYAWLLVIEAVVRLVFVLVGVLNVQVAQVAFACAVGAPLLIAGAAGQLIRHHRQQSRELVTPVADSEQIQFVVVSLAYQICLNSPPILLEWRIGSSTPGAVGAFVAASTYFRSPSMLVGGISTHALTALSRNWGARDMDAFVGVLGASVRKTALTVVPTTVTLLVLAPWLLPLYYGGDVNIPGPVLVALAVSTVLAVGAAVGAAPLFASGRGASAATAWAAGAAMTIGPLSLSPGDSDMLVAGLVIGPTVALGLVGWQVGRLVRQVRAG